MTEWAEGEMNRVRKGCLMKEMNRCRRLRRQEMEREMKERRQSACLYCHATAKKGPADTSVCVFVFISNIHTGECVRVILQSDVSLSTQCLSDVESFSMCQLLMSVLMFGYNYKSVILFPNASTNLETS